MGANDQSRGSAVWRIGWASLALPALCLLITAGMWSAVLTNLSAERDRTLMDAERRAQGLARAFEAHSARALQQIDQVTRFVAYDIARYGSAAADLPALVRRSLIDQPGVVAVSIANATGDVVASSIEGPKINIADRGHFRVHLDAASANLFISQPVLGRLSKKWVVQMTRRLVAPGGEFFGVVVVGVDPAYFTDFYTEAQFGRRGLVSFVGLDWIVRGRRSGDQVWFGDRAGQNFLAPQVAKSTEGIYRAGSKLDDVQRVLAYKVLTGYPFVALAGLAEDEVLVAHTERRRAHLLTASLATVFLVGAFGGLHVLLQQLRRSNAQARSARADADAKAQQLSLQQAELKALTDASPLGVFRSDRQGNQLYVNRTYEQITGLVGEQALGLNWIQAVDIADMETMREQWRKLLKGEGQFAMRIRLRMADGSRKWCSSRAAPVIIDGEVKGYAGTLSDITESVLKEEALRMSEERLSRALVSSHQVVFDWDIPANQVYRSANMSLLRGGPAMDSTATIEEARSLVHPDDRAAARSRFVAVLKGELDVLDCEYRIHDRGGHWIWIRSQGRVTTRDTAGRAVRFCGIEEDVTARKTAELAREEADAALRKLALQVPGMIYQFQRHPDGRFSFPYASDGIREIYEVTPATAATDAASVVSRLHPDDAARVMQSIERSATDLSLWRETYRVILPHRGERILSGQSSPERLKDGSILWHGLITDVTEQTAAARRVSALREERDAAERATQLRADLMSRVSHELRTPLNAILGFAQLIARDPALRGSHALSGIEQIQRAGEHLLSLINDILDLSSLEAGHGSLKLRPVNVGTLLERCIQMLQPHAVGHGLRLSADASEDLPAAQADARAVKQVLFNLIGNAIKYAGNGCSIVVRASADADHVHLEVRDDGAGIPANKLGVLFQPFTRIGDEARQRAGTGLGLAISQQLCHAMGGRITAASTEGAGATFTVHLKRDTRRPETTGDTGFDLLFDSGQGQAMSTRLHHLAGTVLYIEDEPVNALIMEQFFAELPEVRLRVASNGADGLRMARELDPALVLLDMNLPDMDGLEVLDRLTASGRTARMTIVALSADAQPEQVRKALSRGVDDYLTKPVDFQLLRDRLREWLAC